MNGIFNLGPRENGLYHERTIAQRQLQQMSNLANVTLQSIFALEENVLICSDSTNGIVIEINLSTEKLKVIFKEHEEFWKLSNVRLVRDAFGDALILTHGKTGRGGDALLIIARRNSNGFFETSQMMPIQEKDVCNKHNLFYLYEILQTLVHPKFGKKQANFAFLFLCN